MFCTFRFLRRLGHALLYYFPLLYIVLLLLFYLSSLGLPLVAPPLHLFLDLLPDLPILLLDVLHLLQLLLVSQVALDQPEGASDQVIGFCREVHLCLEFIEEQEGKVNKRADVILADSAQPTFGELVSIGFQHELCDYDTAVGQFVDITCDIEFLLLINSHFPLFVHPDA